MGDGERRDLGGKGENDTCMRVRVRAYPVINPDEFFACSRHSEDVPVQGSARQDVAEVLETHLRRCHSEPGHVVGSRLISVFFSAWVKDAEDPGRAFKHRRRALSLCSPSFLGSILFFGHRLRRFRLEL